MSDTRRWLYPIVGLVWVATALGGCSGGGGDSTPAVPASDAYIQVQPASSYDFGTVTPGNLPAPLEVEIANSGSDPLQISGLSLSDSQNFILDVNAGARPCGGATSLATGDSCTVAVSFAPQVEKTFSETLTIQSNARNTGAYQLHLNAVHEPVSRLNVRINQLEGCPRSSATAYVSVTDQANFPVTQLTAADFQLLQGVVALGSPTSSVFVENVATLAVALVMDYSGSVTASQDVVDDMEDSAIAFVRQMGVADEAEVIKFADDYSVVQPFTAGTTLGKAALETAITTPYAGVNTDLYDALYKAVDDTAARSRDRRAVIVLTDGRLPSSSYTLTQVVDHAKALGVPIFTVGLGNLDPAILSALADGTGGQLYESALSDNLRTIYQQLSDLLFADQYILTFNSTLGDAESGTLTVRVDDGAIPPGEDTRDMAVCLP